MKSLTNKVGQQIFFIFRMDSTEKQNRLFFYMLPLNQIQIFP